jgi:HK97 family phage major capsid protein
MPATDDMITQLAGEIDQQQQFQDKLLEDAKKDGRDLTADDMALIERSRNTMQEKAKQLDPLKQAAEIAASSRAMVGELNLRVGTTRPPEVEYRSAGHWILDYWQAGLGNEEARRRQDLFKRAAAHQTTADNPGLLPAQMIAPIINFIDQSRPMVTALGARDLPSGTWNRPKISQHTSVAPQAGEKTELTSQKMVIGMIPVNAITYGGYVNLSKQNLDWSQPGILDIVIQDLAAQYAIETEKALCTAIDTNTTVGPVIPTGPATPAVVSAAIWTAVGAVYAATKGAGRVIIGVSPDALGLIGPLFAPINPQNAQSPGFSAGDFASGVQGTVSGVPVVMSPGFDAGTIIVLSTAAVEFYENRVGALQVVEPSVLGLQVAYAGYAAALATILPTAIIEITKTP